ncbi:MAG: competence/damage-inducible protein A [Pedosphaera sp.]|nr:competence/damage-inducible protein A [Pedosphaera sp.]
MRIEIINTGSELMLGFVLNTHQQWLCRQLADIGYMVSRQTAINDSGEAIEEAVREALTRADLVITTGGLGPTSDDITRDRIAKMLGCKLREDAVALRNLEEFFQQRHRMAPESTRVQALVPEGAIVLQNAHGTAPGLVMEIAQGRFRQAGKSSLLVMLPGPPRELRPMFTDQVIPFLKENYPLPSEFVCRVLKTTGLGESLIEERIAGPLRDLTDAGLDLGYCARVGEVDVRCAGFGQEGREQAAAAESKIRELLGEHIYGSGDDRLEEVVLKLLTEQAKTLAIAESCTGGFVANRITNVPGASAVLLAGWVTYSNDAKGKCLGVTGATLKEQGAVSEATAREMAQGALRVSGADFAVSVTGIAGPSGGTAEKPVGTVFIALATKESTTVQRQINRYDRETFKWVTSQQALDMVRRAVLTR